MNFNIIENSQPSFLERYDEFISLYNNPNISVREIVKRLGWNTTQLKKARKKGLDEGVIQKRYSTPRYSKKCIRNGNRFKYYSKYYGRFKVCKHHNGKYVYYGIYDSVKVAERMVMELEKVDWDKSKLDEIRDMVLNG